MAFPMAPPGPAGYSLRVQLFPPNAHELTDKPIRSFRVVASPDFTVEEFCAEASRIHHINYGTPLTLKKVQDDLQFDVTQSEILGNLFTSMSTVRFIQASTIPGARDSVSPSSALRFDHSASRKRERDGVAKANKSTSGSSWVPSKRQRMADPDEPLPSQEDEEVVHDNSSTNGHIPDANFVPNSQESVILGNPDEPANGLRNVRIISRPKTVKEIRETPGPSPHPTMLSPYHENGLTDLRDRQSENQDLNHNAANTSHANGSSPRAQAPNSRAKSASYHLQRSTNRGESVSTAVTSPVSVDQRPIQNGFSPTTHGRLPRNNGGPSRQSNEFSIYDVITTDDEDNALSSTRLPALKVRNSPNSGLPGMAWAKNKFSTPPNGSRRTSVPREQTTPGELPMTPNSKQRVERQRQQADETRRARLAAAEAAELRKREADEARQAEERRKAEEERAKREKQEQIEIERSQRAETERKTAAAKAAQLKKEQEAREKEEAREDERRHEQARIAKEKLDAAKRAEERLTQEKAAADEAKRLQEEESAAPKGKTILPPSRATSASASKVQSSTPFIPRGRKSALRFSTSSQALLRSSSPASARESADESFNGVEAPRPKSLNRRVSWDDEQGKTLVMSSTRILPPSKTSTPNTNLKTALASKAQPKANNPPSSATLKNSTTALKAAESSSITPKSSQVTPIPLPARRFTPVPPPRTVPSSRRNVAATAQKTTTTTPQKPTPPEPAKKTTPVVEVPSRKSATPAPQSNSRISFSPNLARNSATPARETPNNISPPAVVASRKSATPVPMASAKSKSVEPERKQPSESSDSSRDSEEDIPNRRSPLKQPPKPASNASDSSDDSEEDIPNRRNTLKQPPKPVSEAADSSDDSEEDIPAQRSSQNQLSGRRGTKKARQVRKASPNQDASSSDEDVDKEKGPDEDETQSHDSRESRSPVVFTQHPNLAESIVPRRSASLDSYDGSEFQLDADEQDQDDSDMEDNRTPRARIPPMTDEAGEAEDSDAAAGKEEEEDEGDERAEDHDPHSSPVLPPHKYIVKASSKPVEQALSNCKDSSSEGYNTQDEIDQQLTSSLYEARSKTPASSAIVYPPTSSLASKPSLKVGVSLTSMSRNKSMLATSSAIQPQKGRRSGPRALLQANGEDSEDSEEESNSDSSGSSDAETQAVGQSTKFKASAQAAVYSDSESNSDSEDEEERQARKARDELSKEIAGLKKSDNGISSPRMYRTGTQQQSAVKENKNSTSEKRSDRSKFKR